MRTWGSASTQTRTATKCAAGTTVEAHPSTISTGALGTAMVSAHADATEKVKELVKAKMGPLAAGIPGL